jgi:hypothetical protein
LKIRKITANRQSEICQKKELTKRIIEATLMPLQVFSLHKSLPFNGGLLLFYRDLLGIVGLWDNKSLSLTKEKG